MANHRKTFSWHDIASLVGVLIIAMFFMWVQHNDHQNTINLLTDELKELRSEASKQPVQVNATIDKEVVLPIGLANNNPGNVKNKGWQGQIGSDKFGHAIFSNYEYGLRAIAITLKNYQRKHGLKTLRAMMKRYCESNQIEYAKFIGKRIGVGIDEEFNVMEHMPEILKAIVKFETGEQPYPDHVFALAGIYATNE